ncbi:MAG: hypothetical protein ABIX12_05560 [Rubrivivax sp.]
MNPILRSWLRRSGAGALALSVVVPGAVFARDETPRIFTARNGALEAVYDANDCVVYYDAYGRRTDQRSVCSRDQVNQSRDAIDRYRREQGSGGSGSSDRRPSYDRDRTPDVTVHGNGSGWVDIGSCRVQYGRDGRRIANPRDCSRDDLLRADRAMETYRREQGIGGGAHNRPPNDRDRIPNVTVNRNGSGWVDIGSCRVQYDRDGQRSSSSPDCSRDDRSRADRAMETYRREQGSGGGAPPNRPSNGGSTRGGEVSMDPNGGGSVRFGRNCVVTFNRDGVQTGADRACSADQRREAVRLFTIQNTIRLGNEQKGSGG